jgi:tRNA-splicing ligase RtcB
MALGALIKVGECEYELPVTYKDGMRVPGVLFGDEALVDAALKDKVVEQVANVAMLPGVVRASLAMPDMHWGYGFPIGGVAATQVDTGGVVSPGGVGFDIACGVRLLRTDLHAAETAPHVGPLMHEIARSVPKGLGGHGRLALTKKELVEAMTGGVAWAVGQGFGRPEDPIHCETGGVIDGADTDLVSEHAIERGHEQLGTLGSGNHFIELQEVMEIYDDATAQAFGLFAGQLTVMIHSGSRGLGHQVCTDYVREMDRAADKYGIHLPDRQLACAPVDSPEGKRYLGAMAAAANFAVANRQLMAHRVRQSFERVLGMGEARLRLQTIYDVSHNVARIETHEVDGDRLRLCLHRKGATRSLGPGHPLMADSPYAAIGQPVIVPGDMGRASYVLVGTAEAESKSWSSTCHGAGRQMSRGQAKRTFNARDLRADLASRGIVVVAGSKQGLVEEAPGAYKDVSVVVDVCERAGLSRRVARLRPLGVLKG